MAVRTVKLGHVMGVRSQPLPAGGPERVWDEGRFS